MSTEQQPIDEPKVQSYQKVASLGGWAGGGRTLWAISVIGALGGLAIGTVAPLFPAIVTGNIGAAMGAIPASIAAFTAIGMGMGFSGGLILGRISGASASVAEEQERRMKRWTAAQLKQIDGNFQEVPTPEVKVEAIEKNASQKLKDSYYEYANPTVGFTMAAIGAVGGLILAAGALATGGAVGSVVPAGLFETLTGVEVGATGITSVAAAFTAYTAGVIASFGALFSLNFPKITSSMTEFSGKLIGGKLIGREWQSPDAPSIHTAIERASRYSTLNGHTNGGVDNHVNGDAVESSRLPHIASQASNFTDKVAEPVNDFERMILKQQSSSSELTIRG